jgi:YegS/Rv2252/BmrU family lipid kinase
MKIKLIANPVAGGDARRKIEQTVAWMQARDVAVDLTLTEARGDAQRAAAAARTDSFDRIVAAGGDGTLNEVINGLAPSDIPLGFIPLGTTNVFALETEIPFDLEQACALVLDGTPRRICLGKADGHRFLLMAGIGFDAAVVRGVSLRLKRRVGKLAYVVSGLIGLCRYRPRLLEVLTEAGVRRQAYGVIISNGRLYGGRFVVSPGASLYTRSLNVCLLLRKTRLGLLRTVVKIAAGRPLLADEVVQLRARKVIVAGAGVPVQVDGDYLGELPRVFHSTFGELKMVLPQWSADLVSPKGKV